MADSAELNELCQAVFAQRPLILVSNRGPVEHQMTGDGRPEARRGSGSVVTAFSSLAQKFEFTWVASAMGEGDRVVSNNGQGPHLKSPLPGHKINLRYVVTPRRVYHKYTTSCATRSSGSCSTTCGTRLTIPMSMPPCMTHGKPAIYR